MSPQVVTPKQLTRVLNPLLSSSLVAFDVDGVLAPIVDHADHAALTPGIDELLAQISTLTTVAIVSGRSLASLEHQFTFPPHLVVIGSHGLERRSAEPIELDSTEQQRYTELTNIAQAAVTRAGQGAWLESKPASVVVHTRMTNGDPTDIADHLSHAVAGLVGAAVKSGHHVVELFARATSKAVAIESLRDEAGVEGVIFFGDDLTDEEAFERFGPTDVGIRVGPGNTAARFRLASQSSVVEVLRQLAGGNERLGL